jgi:hypothetical protein
VLNHTVIIAVYVEFSYYLVIAQPKLLRGFPYARIVSQRPPALGGIQKYNSYFYFASVKRHSGTPLCRAAPVVHCYARGND